MAHSSYDATGTRIAAALGASGGQKSTLLEPRQPATATNHKRAILMCPGHGGSGASFFQAQSSFNTYLQPLADAGYSLLGIDAGGPASFGNTGAVSALSDAYSWVTSVYGARTKVGLLTYSMGGLDSFNWLRRNPSKVAGMFGFATALDINYFGNASYTPAYPVPSGSGSYASAVTAGARPGNYTADVAAAYPSGHTGFSPWEDNADFVGLGVPVHLRTATDDTTVPYAQIASWLALLGDPNYHIQTPDITGGHTGLFTSVPIAEVINFFDALSW